MILLLGQSGYVGQAYARVLQQRRIPYKGLGRDECNYSNPYELAKFLQREKPDFVINAAGFTGKPNVDACEGQRSECLAGNAVLPGTIQKACRQMGIPWGHVSSGCIFTGARADGSGFEETDIPNFTFRQNNCSFYSGTKALGEEALGYEAKGENGNLAWRNREIEDFYVWRLRIPFNEIDGARNYLSKLLRYETLLQAENSISHLEHFVVATLSTWEKKVPYGIYNITNPGKVKTSEVVEMIRKKGISRKTFKYFTSEEEFLKLATLTPRSNCILSADKLLQTGIQIPTVKEAVEEALDKWKPEKG